MPHTAITQVAVAFSRVGQRVHEGPQPNGDVPSEHTSPQRWKGGAQVKSHCPATHVDMPWAGTGQGAQLTPHEPTATSLAQAPPHA